MLDGTTPVWSKVVGPIGTVIANLSRIGWTPELPNQWTDQVGREWTFNTACTKAELVYLKQQVADAAATKLAAQASEHRYGQGSETGTDLITARKHLQKLSREHEYSDYGLLLSGITGGLWPNHRVHEVKSEVCPTCPFCTTVSSASA